MRKRSYRGVVDVVFGGEKPQVEKEVNDKGKVVQDGKRKAEDDGLEKEAEKPLSKTQMRKRAKKVKMEKAEAIHTEAGEGFGDSPQPQADGLKDQGQHYDTSPCTVTVGLTVRSITTGSATDFISWYVPILRAASCASCISGRPVGIPGSVTMFEGSNPGVEVTTAAESLVLESEVDDVTATLLAGGED
ncbi:MAG: hypothetical protein Q9210_001899 [Variospora velana]